MLYNSADADRLMHLQDHDVTTRYLVKREKKVVTASCMDWSPIQLALQSTEDDILPFARLLILRRRWVKLTVVSNSDDNFSYQGFVCISLTEKPTQKVSPQAIQSSVVSHICNQAWNTARDLRHDRYWHWLIWKSCHCFTYCKISRSILPPEASQDG